MNPAVTCLETTYEQIISRHGKALSAGYAPGGRWWRGPWSIRPMIELRPSWTRDSRCVSSPMTTPIPNGGGCNAHINP